MPGESLNFPIFAEDHASKNIRQVGDAAATTAAKLDIAAASAKLFTDSSIKSGKAADTVTAAMKSHANATGLLADAENVLAGKATVTTKLMADQGRAFEDVGNAAEKAAGAGGTSGLSALIGGVQGTSGMGALIGAGVALSPVLVTLGVGLGGLAAAAYGVAKPIENAAQKTGGLAANLGALDPEQQKVAVGLLNLGKQFSTFQHDLQPEVLGIFNQGIKLAGTLMHGVEPVAAATGAAFGTLLGQINAEFKSGTWQNFFAFMARTAGPDVQLLGQTFINLTATLPPLLRLLQPVATDVLGLSAGLSKLVQVSATSGQSVDNVGQHMNFLEKITAGLRTVLFAPGVGLLDALKALHIVGTGAGGGLNDAAGGMQRFQQVTIGMGPIMTGLVNKTFTTETAVDRLGKTAQVTSFRIQETGRNAGLVVSPFDHLGKVADTLFGTFQNLASSGHSEAAASAAVASAWRPVLSGAGSLNTAVAKLNTSMTTLVGNLLTLQGSDLGWKQSLQAAEKQLDSNTAGLAGNSKNALANKQAVLAATNAAIQFAAQQLTLGKNIGQASNTIQAQIRFLQGLHDKSAFVRSELAALRKEEALLNAQRISQTVQVNGIGRWSVAGPGGSFRSGGIGGATGGLVTGGTPGKDSVPILAMPGEAVVPTHLTPAVAPFLKAHGVPGFAAGGIVGSYSGSAGGLKPWLMHNDTATIALIDRSVASATLAGIRAAVRAASSVGGVSGPGGGAPSANAALAHRLYASQLSPASWAAWNFVAMAESGWNQFARNPGSGAYGIAQALPPTKYPFAGQAAGGSNPMAQITWMWNYMAQRYGGPLGAQAHEAAFRWYDQGGWLPPGLSLAYNGTGSPERVGGGNTYNVNITLPPGSDREQGRRIVGYIRAFEIGSGAGWRS